MTHKLETNLKGGVSADFSFDDCADPVQSNSSWKIFSDAAEQL